MFKHNYVFKYLNANDYYKLCKIYKKQFIKRSQGRICDSTLLFVLFYYVYYLGNCYITSDVLSYIYRFSFVVQYLIDSPEYIEVHMLNDVSDTFGYYSSQLNWSLLEGGI
jgi:uncharacterized protein (UPF0303 family)